MKYYLHDSSAFQDEKITELFINFGYEGLGLFYTLLEKLAFQEKPIKTIVLKRQLKVGKRLDKCWNFMEKIELIHTNNGETFNKQLLNFSEKYQIKNKKNAERISQWREKQKDTESVTHYESVRNTPKVNRSKVIDNIYNNTTLIEKGGMGGKTLPSWRTDFSIYLKECKEAFGKLYDDKEFISKQQLFYPNVNIKKTIHKAYENFWGTEAGWKNKKQSRSKTIDWKQTIVNSLAMPTNKVYYTKEELVQ